ncbi:MAG: AmmeMemoRadiSam system protein B [Candidatus Omnitrophota bacterium]
MSGIRKPAVAGAFYPGDKKVLETMVEKYLAEVPASPKVANIFGLISPHAGYQYSGKVAAYGFAQVKGKDYHTVILLGPSHQAFFEGIAIYPSGSWETPLGNVPVDAETAKIITEKCAFVKPDPPVFENEHSLEVQIPFLQKTLKNFKIVPIMFGGLKGNEYQSFTDALVGILRKRAGDVLVIASSDMSHYHPYEKAVQMDRLVLKSIEKIDPNDLIPDLNSGKAELCGASPVIALLLLAQNLDSEVKTLKYANSGDVTGDKGRVVGYGSVAFSYANSNVGVGFIRPAGLINQAPTKLPGNSKNGGELDKNEQKELLQIARKTLEEYIASGKTPHFEPKSSRLSERRGVFVTLKKKDSLRGCIGYIRPVEPLYQAVTEMAVSASTKDYRFPRVSAKELKEIKIEITVLSPLKLIDQVEEIEVGRHGLYISKGGLSGLLLPQVATEYGWNRQEFLEHTCQKAGLPPNAWKEKDSQIYIFSGQVFGE